MDVQDLLFSSDVSLSLKQAVMELCHEHNVSAYAKVLVPTADNNDVNGSQHHSETIDFTYQDATEADVASASSLGYYEYFSEYYGRYTGHYYNGDGRHFEAIVLDPPAYAATVTV